MNLYGLKKIIIKISISMKLNNNIKNNNHCITEFIITQKLILMPIFII